MAPKTSDMEACVNHILQAQQAIKYIATVTSQLKEVPRNPSVKFNKMSNQVDDLLSWLEDEVRMTPVLRARSKVHETLRVMFTRDDVYFPDAQKLRAEALYQRFDAVHWNEVSNKRERSEDVDSAVGLPNRKKARGTGQSPSSDEYDAETTKYTVYLPSEHPIWGEAGIMHGAASSLSYRVDGSKRLPLKFNDRYERQRRSARVLGHNSIESGSWYPRQIIACFHGAHGHTQAGVFGDENSGACSIIVSGQYDDLDTDHGDYLYYSAPNSHNNEDPRRVADAKSGSLALRTSMRERKPVRVLRTSTGKSRWAPTSGIRYDGLYLVTALNHPKNDKGGLYEQFCLERQEGQEPIDQNRPNAREIRDELQISTGYPGAMR